MEKPNPKTGKICPHCGKPAAQIEAGGVCADCKFMLRTKHAKVLTGADYEEPEGSTLGPISTTIIRAHVPPTGRHFDDNSETIATTEGDDAEAFHERFCREFGVNMETSLEMMAYIANHLGATSGGAAIGGVTELMKNCWLVISRKKLGRPMAIAVDCWAMAMAWNTLLGVDEDAELAKRWGVSKQNITKQVNLFRDVIPPGMSQLPDRPGERTNETRWKFQRETKERHNKKRQQNKTTK